MFINKCHTSIKHKEYSGKTGYTEYDEMTNTLLVHAAGHLPCEHTFGSVF